jgi:RIO kinase 1
MAKKSAEKFKVYNNVFDEFTNRNLFMLESKGLFVASELTPFSMGKEANVFWGTGQNGAVVVKIYRLQNCDFNRMYDYIKFDPRFMQLKRHRRKIILGWVQREYRNLLKAREAGMNAPTPYAILNNVIVMQAIGKDEPSPKIKDMAPKNPSKFLDEVMANVKRLYKAGLVHGDLSKFNILNDDEKPVFIDFSQATTLKNQNALEYVTRDVKNICDYFSKLGVKIDYDKELQKIMA